MKAHQQTKIILSATDSSIAEAISELNKYKIEYESFEDIEDDSVLYSSIDAHTAIAVVVGSASFWLAITNIIKTLIQRSSVTLKLKTKKYTLEINASDEKVIKIIDLIKSTDRDTNAESK